MHYGVIMDDWGEHWRRAMEEWSGGYSMRTLDDAEERKFWAGFMKDRKGWRQDEYAGPIAERMKEIIEPLHPDRILEIGPGWGNYTFMLAGLCKEMRCTDISEDVLNYIRETGRSMGYEIRMEACKWEEYEGVRADVIVAFNCFYRMREIEKCLEKINEYADRLCVIGMTSGPDQPYFKEMEHVMGAEIKYHRLDYIYLYNILYRMGIDCNVAIVPVHRRDMFASLEEAVEQECRRIRSQSYDRHQAKKILEKYLKQEPDGSFSYDHTFYSAILYWEPKKLIKY